MNSECPVCGAEGADLSACQGKEPEQSQENENSPAESEKSTCICTTKCAEGSVNSECPVCSAAGADLAVCVGEASQPEPPQVTTIKTWNWIGGDNLNNGVLSLIGAGAENPVDFATVVSLLPTGITAAVEGSADPVE